MIDPHTILSILPDAPIHPDARAARRITWDSRQTGPETAFVALPGERTHGNAYIAQALERGAPFVLTDQDAERGVRVPDARAALRAWARHARDGYPGTVIGITGSAGKTTAKEYAGAALGARYTPGNLNTLDAIACFLLEACSEADSGPPSAVHPNDEAEIRGQTSDVRRDATQLHFPLPTPHSPLPLVVEMGIDRIGEMAQLMALVSPDYGIITAIGEAHLEFFGTLETIAREKGGILAARRFALVSARAGARWYPGLPTYGLEHATYQPSSYSLQPSAQMTYRGVEVRVPTSSAVVLEAAVLGLALAEELRIPLEGASERISRVEVPGGRWRVLEAGGVTLIDDSYNANPLSVRAALEGLRALPGRKFAVLGDMLELGPEAGRLHREIGELASGVAERVYSVGEFREALSAHPFDNGDELARVLLEALEPGDVVLFKASRGVRLEAVLEKLLEGLRG